MPDCRRLRVAFAGTPEFAAVALQGLLDSDHEVVVVLSQPDRPAGRGRKLLASPVKQMALAAGLPVQQPLSLKTPEAQAELTSMQADVMVVAAYGLILPTEVLAMPVLGCLNIHGSLLPRWRGAAPIHRAILHGDEHTGICIMQMDEGLDTGAVLSRHVLEIGPDETTGMLHDRLADLGCRALLDTLVAHCEGSLTAVLQPEEGVTYAEKLSKAEAVLDFSQSANDLHRRVCAFNPWPVAESTLAGERVRIWGSEQPDGGLAGRDLTKSDLAESEFVESAFVEGASAVATAKPGTILAVGEAGIDVATGEGVLRLTSLQRPGGKAMAARVFAQDRKLTGIRFGDVE